MRRLVSLMLVLSALMFFAGLAQATTLMALSVSDLAREADLVVRGVVVSQRVESDKSNGRLYTYTTLRRDEALKGAAVPDTLTIRQMGGEKDGVGMAISGTPKLVVGQELVVFLLREGDLYFLKGMGQGLFEVVKENGVEMAVQGLSGASLASPDPVSGRIRVEESTDKRLKLVDLKAEIARALGK